MPSSLTQRQGPFTRQLIYLDGTRGSDAGITTGYVLPLRDQSGFQISRPEVDVPYFNGTIQGWGSAPGAVSGAGSIPMNLDFLTSGTFLKMPFGANGYTRTALVTGSVHAFFPPTGVTTPLTAQIQSEYLEGTPVYERARYVMLQNLAIGYQAQGGAPFDVTMIASGDVVLTDLAGVKTENGSPGISVYNGQARLAVAALNPTWFTVQPTAFRAALDTAASREDASFNDGVAVSVNTGIPMLKGNLELAMANGGATPESDFTFLSYSINRNLLSYDCLWTDAAFGASPFPTQYFRLTIATLRTSRQSTRPGGQAGRRIGQEWDHVLDSTLSKIAAESFGTVVGPYNISAGVNDVVSHNIDALGASSVTLTAGAARTAAQVAADLNGNGTFSARAVADVFMGRVRITSKQTGGSGATSSVALTAAANNANATLGFNTTTISGFNTPYIFRIYNLQNTNY